MRGLASGGLLVVAGVGIKVAAHVTPETRGWIRDADRVFFVANDPVMADWVREIAPEAEDLAAHYAPGKRRLATYTEMVERILDAVRAGHRVCALFYGHPGVFVTPSHQAVRQAREEGFEAVMLPGVSAEDCLYADLGLDPADGCQSYEASDFLARPRRFDTSTHLVLWQIGVIGSLDAPVDGAALPGLALLVEVLAEHYGPEHRVVVYEAARYPTLDPSIRRLPLRELPGARVTQISTLYVPPLGEPAPDVEMIKRLGLSLEMLGWEKD